MTGFSGKSWSDVQPHFRFLKEILQVCPKNEVEAMLNKEFDLKIFDAFMIAESSQFLRLSIINLLAYKNLVCGNYLAWARVTIYYSQFYIVNCLLRLKRYALAHLEFINEDNSSIVVSIFKPRNSPNYRVQKCTASGHQIVWSTFAEKYPEFHRDQKIGKELGKFSIKERTDWNYDLFYASQTTGEYALSEARDRCKYNFLDPSYGSFYSNEEEAEHYQDLMANFGYEEAGTRDYQQCAIDCLLEIAKTSKYSGWYSSQFSDMLNDIDLLESPKQTKDEISKWLENAISQIKQ